MAREINLQIPVSETQIQELKVGDIVTLSGLICAGRDHFHKRVLDYSKKNLQFPSIFHSLVGCGIYHMGPIVKQDDQGNYKIISGGPTTSARMNAYQAEVCKILGIKMVIGKGGMDGINWTDINAVYLQYPGGAGALITKFISKVKTVEWLDLGTPEAAWFLDVNNFGPLVVTIDTHGGNLYNRD